MDIEEIEEEDAEYFSNGTDGNQEQYNEVQDDNKDDYDENEDM